MAQVRIMTIGEVCASISDTYRNKAREVILINTSDVLEGKVLNHSYVPNVGLKGQFKKTFIKNDILYSEIRPQNKRFAFVDFDPLDYIASTKLMVIRAESTIVLPLYLFYYLKSQPVIDTLQMLAETRSGTFPQITFTELSQLTIPVPPLEVQQTIVDTIKCIEDKLNVNYQINDNLQQHAYAYFIQTFVENADPSWCVGTLSDLGTIVGGGTPSKAKPEYYTDNGIAWITPKDLSVDKSKFISHGANDISELGYRNSSATMMPLGTVLFSSRAPIGYIAIAKNDVTTNQGFKSVVPKPEIGTPYVYFFLRHNLPLIESKASGSTFKEVSGSVMKSVEAVIPDSHTISKFNDFCFPIFEMQEKLERENRNLAALRDSLLPKLMSGEIDLSGIQI